MPAGESSVTVAAGFGSDSVLCVDGAPTLSIPAALQGFLLPAYGPIFSSPVRAPHN